MDQFFSLKPGVWLLASLNSHETMKGMRVKFQDVECFRDYQYDYSDYGDQTTKKEFTLWKPPSLEEIQEKTEKTNSERENLYEIDFYSERFAVELGLRSLKNQSSSSDVELLDLSFLEYDAIDVPDRDVNDNLNFTGTEIKNKTIPNSNGLNETSDPHWKEVDGLNQTAVNLLTQSITKNATHMWKRNTSSVLDNSFYNTENMNGTTNSSVILNNLIVSDRNMTNVHNATALSMVRNGTTEKPNDMGTLQENSSSIPETERMNVVLTSDNQTFVDMIMAVDSEEKINRGDAFSYLLPSDDNIFHSTTEGKTTTLSYSAKQEKDNKTVMDHVNVSADGVQASLSFPKTDAGGHDVNSTEKHNLTVFEVVVGSKDNNTNNLLNTTSELDYGLHTNSSEIVTTPTPSNSSLENIANIWILHNLEDTILQNVTANISTSFSSVENEDSTENVIAPLVEMSNTSSVKSLSNKTTVSSNLFLFDNEKGRRDSEGLSASDIREEVFIYLKENNPGVIKTTSVEMQGHNWTYEGTHQVVPMEIPDYIMNYFEKTPPTTPTPKRTRKVNVRQRPQKGQGMKTKRRKEYKPQPRSGLPFSPRGFNPGMTPRGPRPQIPQPISNEEDFINTPVVIGVPRPDFSDYELYIPGDEPDHLKLDEKNVKPDEYEYVSFKDPYGSHEDIKTLNLDETTKYYLKISGPNVRTYFIAVEEVEWDYAGYGQR